jgi:hypothetical protein
MQEKNWRSGMDRRNFLKAALAVPAVAAAMRFDAVAASDKQIDDLLDARDVDFIYGYQYAHDITWMRASMTLPDGRDFHDVLHMGGPPTPEKLEKLKQATVEYLIHFIEENYHG